MIGIKINFPANAIAKKLLTTENFYQNYNKRKNAINLYMHTYTHTRARAHAHVHTHTPTHYIHIYILYIINKLHYLLLLLMLRITDKFDILRVLL